MNILQKFTLFSVILASNLFVSCSSAPKNPWRDLTTTAPVPAESIGFYSAGCLKGATSLYPDGVGYHAMRISRRRFYGHPSLVQFIEELGIKVSKKKLGCVLVGDLGQPRGGPSLSGHASHQNGLDVDLWYWRNCPQKSFTLDERENLSSPSVLNADGETLHAQNWRPEMIDLLQIAAEDSRVERIFVHPVIKRELCRSAKDHRWLQKVRPWWGHDDHFHVRLKCPSDNPNCKVQEAVTEGDGCDQTLAEWFSPEFKEKAKQRAERAEPPRMPELPQACEEVLKL